MKKLALLLAALGVVSAATYAAPELTVTNFGQSIETENVSGGADIDDVWLWNTVGLKYGDWNFGLTAGKDWSVNYDHHRDVTSNNSRLQFDVSKKITDDFTLTGRYRGQKNYDRFQVGYKYNFGMFSTSGDLFYDFADNGTDTFHAELFPIAVTYGPVKVAYFVEYVRNMEEILPGAKEDYIDHQIRAYATLYKGEQLTLSTEGRFTIVSDETWKDEKNGKAVAYNHYDDFGKNRLYLKANYAMTENLDVFGSVGYEIREFKGENGAKDDNNKYWSNVVIGYNYKF